MARPYYATGAYRCEITDHALGETKNKNPQFVLRFRVLEGEDGSDCGERYERSFYRVITDKTMPYFLEDLDALQWPEVHRFADLDLRSGVVDMRGRVVTMWCKHEPGMNGDTREVWAVAMMGRAEIEQLSPQASMKLDSMFGKVLKGRNASNPAPRPAASRPADPPLARPQRSEPDLQFVAAGPDVGDGWEPSDDDCPF